MIVAVGRRKPLAAVLLAALLTVSVSPLASSAANDGVDPTTTGAINPAALPTDSKGSAAFRSALDLLNSGKAADAYAAARALPSNVERQAVQWVAIYYHARDLDYPTIQRFAEDAPGFVPPGVYKSRLEQALTKARPASSEIIRILGGAMPNTISAQIALAIAYKDAGDIDRATPIARSIWRDNYLDRTTEERVRNELGSLLDAESHWARAVHLMMNDRASGVERLLSVLSPAQKSLAVARIAVSRKAKDAKALLDKVDPTMTGHPVFLFSRAQRARQADLYESAVEWLNKAQGPLPDAEEWWYERRTLVRNLLADGNAQLAYKAAAGYTEGPEGRQVEARFHAGWIALSFLNDAQSAKTHFTTMRSLSTLPDSVTQASYWLGRALTKLGDAEGAKAAFEDAARHGSVYYGLLARAELGLGGAGLRSMPASEGREAAFESNQVIQAVRLLAQNGHKIWATTLLRGFAGTLKEGADLLLAARLAQEIGAHDVAIVIADIADRRGAPLDLFSFPKDGLPPNAKLAEVDKAAVYAITRQESMFRVDAQSGVGARGLMQLMPATAKETAGQLGIEYSANRLTTDPAYNALLGSTYLAKQLRSFEGSLVLAAAAYNSGASNARKWIRAYGDPRLGNVDPVIWVELIPFQETRKYVQRVLGNYLVYRTRLGDESMTIKEALRKIP